MLHNFAFSQSRRNLLKAGAALPFLYSPLLRANEAPQASFTVADLSGREIRLPEKISGYFVKGRIPLEMAIMADGAKKLKGFSTPPEGTAWLYTLCKGLENCKPSSEPQAFQEIQNLCQVAFSDDENDRELFRSLGVPMVNVGAKDTDGLKQAVTLLSTVLKEPGNKKAAYFNDDLDRSLQTIESRVKSIPQNSRPKVLVCASLDGTGTWEADPFLAASLEKVGAQAVELPGKFDSLPMTINMLSRLKPDFVLTFHPDDKLRLLEDPVWQPLGAVQKGKVILNPSGGVSWNRCGPEYFLQLLWLAKTVHPYLYPDINKHQMVKDFYNRYFHFVPDEREVELMLCGRNPDGTVRLC